MAHCRLVDWSWTTISQDDAAGRHTFAVRIIGVASLNKQWKTLLQFDLADVGLLSHGVTRVNGNVIQERADDPIFNKEQGTYILHRDHLANKFGSKVPDEIDVEVEFIHRNFWRNAGAHIEFDYPVATFPPRVRVQRMSCTLDLTHLVSRWGGVRRWLVRQLCGAKGTAEVFSIRATTQDLAARFPGELVVSFSWGMHSHENPVVIVRNPNGPSLARVAFSLLPLLIRMLVGSKVVAL